MVTRKIVALALIAAVGLASCRSTTAADHALAPGSRAPPALAGPPGAIRVIWVFSGADLLRCRNSARELRHVDARFGLAVELTAIAVDASEHDVRSFLRAQRVPASVRHLRKSEAVAVRGIRWPAVYVVQGNIVKAAYLGVPLDDTRSMRLRDVEKVVASLLGRSDASGEQNPTFHGSKS